MSKPIQALKTAIGAYAIKWSSEEVQREVTLLLDAINKEMDILEWDVSAPTEERAELLTQAMMTTKELFTDGDDKLAVKRSVFDKRAQDKDSDFELTDDA